MPAVLARKKNSGAGKQGRGPRLHPHLKPAEQTQAMPESMTPGIQIDEVPLGLQPIVRVVGAVTAFVGRALRGPINTPVTIRNNADFQQVFGGLWQPSPLSYAVEQFFEHGGREAVIVRVVNGATPPTLSLPCGRETLTLVGLSPGSREFLRAAIDYDNIGDNEEDRFNLVIQRLRAPASERIDAQEIFRGLSSSPAAPRYVALALLESQLVRVLGRVPALRPDITTHGRPGRASGYVGSNPDGSDGVPLTDYDVIGSAQLHTGLFALNDVPHLDFVHIPPLSRTEDIGPSSLVVASRYCRERRALLIVDPPACWNTTEEALSGLRELNFSSADACMFFPRLVATDRLRGTAEVFGNGGAVAGMLTRAEEQRPVWQVTAPEPELLLRPGTRLACTLTEKDRWRLAANGINSLQAIRTAGPVRLVPRTLAGGSHAAADWGYVGARRFGLFLLNSIERGTRWIVMQHANPSAWRRVRRQIGLFLHEIEAEGAFPGAEQGKAWFVITDARINTDHESILGLTNILVGFAASRPGEYHSYLITHGPHGSMVRPIAVNPVDQFWAPEPEPEDDNVVYLHPPSSEPLPGWG